MKTCSSTQTSNLIWPRNWWLTVENLFVLLPHQSRAKNQFQSGLFRPTKRTHVWNHDKRTHFSPHFWEGYYILVEEFYRYWFSNSWDFQKFQYKILVWKTLLGTTGSPNWQYGRSTQRNYEVRSETKLVFRLVDPLFRAVSLSTEFVASTFQIVSGWIAPIRLVDSPDRLVVSFFYWTRRYRVRLVDFWDRLIMYHFIFDSSSVEFVSSTPEIDSSWVDLGR